MPMHSHEMKMTFATTKILAAEANIYCPFCQQAVIDWEQEQYVQPCEHTLYIAMDLGFEFISDRFEAGLSQSVDEIHEDPNMNILATLREASYPVQQQVQAELGVEGMYRYVGFSQQ